MGYKRKSWQEKLQDKKNFPSVHKLQKNFPCYNSVHKMGADVGDDVVLANPSEIVEEMKTVGCEVYTCGDVNRPRDILSAVKEGLELGLKI